MKRSAAWCVALAALALATCTHCFTPPAILASSEVDLPKVLKRYPIESEVVAIEVEPGVVLRGVFATSQPNAPVVLHLLESSGSVASDLLHFAPVARQLSDRGYASLIVDYTGVGLSDGERSVANLPRDARAMWNEALRRAGGDPSRVYVRATSIGTIASALLLESGTRPAAMVWIAPVLPESATHRFARAFHGRIAGWIAAWLYDDISDVDVVEVLRDAQVPGVVIASPEDGLLTAEERAAIAGAISPAAGFMERDGGHVVLATEAHALLREELPVFVPCCTPEHVEQRVGAVLAELPPGVSARFPDGSAERTRLEQLCRLQRGARADSVAAAALAIPHAEIAARVLWLHSYRSYYTLEFDEWLAAMSLDDPAGQLPIELIERASLLSDFSQEFGFGRKAYTAAAIEAAGVAGGAHASHVDDRTVVEAGDEPVILSLDGRAMFEELLARGLDVADAERQFVRILLKSQRIPDRLRIAPDGRVAVEVKEKGTWRTLAMDPARIDLAPIPMMYEIRLTDSVPSEAGTSTFKIRSR